MWDPGADTPVGNPLPSPARAQHRRREVRGTPVGPPVRRTGSGAAVRVAAIGRSCTAGVRRPTAGSTRSRVARHGAPAAAAPRQSDCGGDRRGARQEPNPLAHAPSRTAAVVLAVPAAAAFGGAALFPSADLPAARIRLPG